MPPIDPKAFRRRMDRLSTIYRVHLDDEQVEGYRRALSDLSVEQLDRACQHAVKTSKFMPRPAELRALLAGEPVKAHGIGCQCGGLGWLYRACTGDGDCGLPRCRSPHRYVVKCRG